MRKDGIIMKVACDDTMHYRNGHSKRKKSPLELMTFDRKDPIVEPLTKPEQMNWVIAKFLGWRFSTQLHKHDLNSSGLKLSNPITGEYDCYLTSVTMHGTRLNTLKYTLKHAVNNSYGRLGYGRDFNSIFKVIEAIEKIEHQPSGLSYKFNICDGAMWFDLGLNTDRMALIQCIPTRGKLGDIHWCVYRFCQINKTAVFR